jgi:hypothetical protein
MSTYAQRVVAGRSSSRPAEARISAPVHTDMTIPAFDAAVVT